MNLKINKKTKKCKKVNNVRGESGKTLIICVVLIIIAVIVIFIITRMGKKEDTIIDNTIEATVATRDQRRDTAIENAVRKLEDAGLVMQKGEEISAEEAIGYNYLVNGETIGIYYIEKSKLADMKESGSSNGEIKVRINGKTQNALAYNNILILNCTLSETIEIINQTLNQNRIGNLNENN